MAQTPAEKTAEETSKSMKRLVQLIEMRGGNSAEIKKEKKEKKDLVNQEQELMGKYSDLIDEDKKELAKKTQTFKSISGFIGIEAKKYFATTEKNMVTWGGLGTAIKTGVKDWFKSAMKQRTALGATLRLGATLWKATHEHIITRVKDIFGRIGTQIREVLGDLAEVFDVIKGVFVSTFKFFKDTLFGVFEKVPPHQRKRNRLLQKILGIFQRREKIDLIGAGKKSGGGDKSIWLILGMVAAGLIGAFIRKFLLPFELLIKVSKIGVFTKKFWNWIKGFRFIGKMLAPFIGVGGMTDKIATLSGKFMVWFPKFTKSLGFLFKAFKFGFKFLGWPLTIILGVIDFIKGFISTEGNLADKILGGLKGAVMGFIELPIRFVGWVVEKVLGLFGVEVDGIANKILGAVEWIMDAWFSFFRPIIGFFEGFFSTEGSFIDKIKGGLFGFFTGLQDFFKILQDKWQSLLKFFGMGEEETKPPKKGEKKKGGFWSGIFGGDEDEPKTTTPGTNKLKEVVVTETNSKNAQSENSTQELKDALEKQTKDQIKSNEDLAKENPNIAIGVGGGGVGAPPSLPAQDQIIEREDGMIMNNNDF